MPNPIGPNLLELLRVSSAPLCDVAPTLSAFEVQLAGELAQELLLILRERNGFFAFESALHFLPSQNSLLSVGIAEWNRSPGWRDSYGDLAQGCLFFAEDIFGGQFCVRDRQICAFDPETGIAQGVADSFENWAAQILADFPVLTGHPIARSWQEVHGPIPAGYRLIPRTPFVCGGEYAIENLALVSSENGMKIRGGLARQLIDIPDGTAISFQIED